MYWVLVIFSWARLKFSGIIKLMILDSIFLAFPLIVLTNVRLILMYQIINAIMSGRDVLVIMVAGGGKSLCYQLPSGLHHGIALVHLCLPHQLVKFIYKALENGEGDLKVLYVTLEKVSKSKNLCQNLKNATMLDVFPSSQLMYTHSFFLSFYKEI
uniref:DNA 3'-5' helicase n=1 Tax=Lactuca sativa TaxID=4236 RepID=A0A9R1UVN0_LACSA|nr:hypothetical protein LSAT_V11C800434170 [Lactuca sativa]